MVLTWRETPVDRANSGIFLDLKLERESVLAMEPFANVVRLAKPAHVVQSSDASIGDRNCLLHKETGDMLKRTVIEDIVYVERNVPNIFVNGKMMEERRMSEYVFVRKDIAESLRIESGESVSLIPDRRYTMNDENNAREVPVSIRSFVVDPPRFDSGIFRN